MSRSGVLLAGFGGPRKLEEVRPFLQSVTAGSKIPEKRIREVYHHYELVGGRSRFNEVTELQREALEKELIRRKNRVPVAAAYYYSTPSFKEVFEYFKPYGIEHVICVILASFESFASRGKYMEKIEEARRQAGAGKMNVFYIPSFDREPLFLKAQAERVLEVSLGHPRETMAFFTAHSIPLAMHEKSVLENGGRGYDAQFREASGRVAALARLRDFRACYQSRSGSPKEPWLGPDVKEEIASLAGTAFKGVLLVPVGFLCDNVEVVYDLDIEARQAAEAQGLQYRRAGTVADHPQFIKMLADKVTEVL